MASTDTYQLMEGAMVAAYEIETTPGTDPAANRNRWIGAVLGVPSLTEDYGHQDYQPLGSGPDPHFIQKKMESFEVEFENLVDVPYSTIGDNELLSLAMGIIDGPGGGDTGIVTFQRPLRCATFEWGWKNPGVQVDTFEVLSAVDSRVYEVQVDEFSFTYTATVPTDTESDIRDALVTEINNYRNLEISSVVGTFQVGETITGGTSAATATVLFVGDDFLRIAEVTGTLQAAETITGGTSSATATTDAVPASIVTAASSTGNTATVTADVSGTPFTFAVTSDGTTPSTDMGITSRVNTSWFHLLKGAKINTVAWTFRPDDRLMMRFGIIGRIHEGREAPVLCTGVSLDELTVPAASSVHNSHATWTLQDQDSNAIDTIIREFDLAFTNNIDRIWSDNQQFYASHLVEGNRRWTFNMKTSKTGNELLDISRSDPGVAAGQLDLTLVVDQASGWYMSLNMPKVALAERSATLQSDVTHVEEDFAGVAIGVVTLDMNKAV